MNSKVTLKDAIAYYEQHGVLGPYAIMGGDGTGEEDDNPGGEGKNGKEKPATFTQDDLDRVVKERLKREKDSIRTEVIGELQRQAAEEKKKKDGEWEGVVAEKDTKISQLETNLKNLEKFEELAQKRFDNALKAMPEAIKILAPDTDSILEKEKWLVEKAIPAMEKLQQSDPKDPKRGANNGRDPKPITSDKEKTLQEIAKSQMRTGLYNF